MNFNNSDFGEFDAFCFQKKNLPNAHMMLRYWQSMRDGLTTYYRDRSALLDNKIIEIEQWIKEHEYHDPNTPE